MCGQYQRHNAQKYVHIQIQQIQQIGLDLAGLDRIRTEQNRTRAIGLGLSSNTHRKVKQSKAKQRKEKKRKV